MSTFPDCRYDGSYNVDFLDEKDSEFVKGFDYALETIINLFSANLDVFQNELTETLAEGETCAEDEILSTKSDLYDSIIEYYISIWLHWSSRIISENNILLSCIIEQWHEMERDMLVTSMIDNMDDETYNLNRKIAIAKHKGKYYDSRKFAITGEKEFVEE